MDEISGLTEPCPRYSVVITAHNERESIRACVASLAGQQGVEPGDVEIIVVDDRSTDDTVAEAQASNLRGLRLIRIECWNAGSITARQNALDRGLRAARGEVILTLDADGLVRSDWVRQMAGPILAGQADAIAGAVSFRGPRGWLAAVQTMDVCFYLTVCRALTGLGLAGGVLFGNCAFRGSLYTELGGFETIGFALTEDFAFARAAHRAGRRIAYPTGGAVSVRACRSWSDFAKRTQRVSSGGVSALLAVLGVWMASLPLLGAAAASSGNAMLIGGFALRYAAGAAFVAAALARYGHGRLGPLALLYEPLMTIMGLVVLWRIARGRRVEWGDCTIAAESVAEPGIRAQARRSTAGIVRPYEARDRKAIREICCRTAYRNRGALAVFEDPEVFADYWCNYYTDFEPESCLVVEEDGHVIGYLLGCVDSRNFVRIMGRRIVPRLLLRIAGRLIAFKYRQETTRRALRWAIFHAWKEDPGVPIENHPAHYHCNVLRQGLGKNYLTTMAMQFLDRVERLGVETLHVQVLEPASGGVWQRMLAAYGHQEAVCYRAEKPSSFYRIVFGDSTEMVNRAWAMSVAESRALCVWAAAKYGM